MSDESELARWRAQWTDDSAWVPTDLDRETDPVDRLRRRIRRRNLMLLALTATEIVFVTAIGGLMIRLSRKADGWLTAATLLSLGLISVAALAFALINRRHELSGPRGVTTADHVAYLLARCRRRQREIRFGWGLLLAEVLLIGVWLVGRGAGLTADRASTLMGFAGLAALAAAAGGALYVLGRRTGHEAARYRAWLDDDGSASGDGGAAVES